MASALFFLLVGFALGMIATYALIRVERSTPRPLPRSRPRASVSSPTRAASPSNCRLVPKWEREYATEYAARVREHGQNFADGRE